MHHSNGCCNGNMCRIQWSHIRNGMINEAEDKKALIMEDYRRNFYYLHLPSVFFLIILDLWLF